MEQHSFSPRPSAIETAAKQDRTGTSAPAVPAAAPFADKTPPVCSQALKISASSTTHCKNCGVKLTADDKAINLKLISRTVTEFLCIDCLGDKLGCGRAPIEERIRYYRESGSCTLFR